MELRWVDADGVRAPVLTFGPPAAPPAVLVPGLSDGLAPVTLPATQALMRDAPLPMRHFRCLVVSYADRPTDADAPTTAGLAREVAAVLDAVTDQPAWLFAHSMGAMVAQHLAATRPDLVAGLVLSATCARADARLRRGLQDWQAAVEARDWHRFARAAVATSFTGLERSRRRLLLRLSSPPGHPDDRVARHVALTAAAVTHDAREQVLSIRCPTLVLAGEHDPLCPPERGRELAAAIPDATFEVFDGLAHGFPEQAPGRFARRVLAFLDAHGAQPDPTADPAVS
ncbi:alpha/beta fold hydrolase [Egicoccus sp. AB-alg2]|uniref:alpha/beta fold hydrolase n=1 Tax=Egicoccus sp. AB-alg2 TaxID=3242693 RepID=UPI00359E06FA